MFDPDDTFNRMCFVIFIAGLLLMMSGLVFGEERVLPLSQPADTVAVEALIAQFDSTDILIRTDEDGCMMTAIPSFVAYAEAAAKLDGAAPILAEILAGETPDGLPRSPQARIAASVALEAIGPEAMIAEPTLREMLASPLPRENIMALAIIRGIGPDAAPLLGHVRTLLHAENFHVSYWACRAVAAMGDAGEPAVGDLCLLLTTDQPASVRRNACIALKEVAGCSTHLQKVVQILIDVVEGDYSYPVRVEASAALEKFFGPPVTEIEDEPTPGGTAGGQELLNQGRVTVEGASCPLVPEIRGGVDDPL